MARREANEMFEDDNLSSAWGDAVGAGFELAQEKEARMFIRDFAEWFVNQPDRLLYSLPTGESLLYYKLLWEEEHQEVGSDFDWDQLTGLAFRDWGNAKSDELTTLYGWWMWNAICDADERGLIDRPDDEFSDLY